MVDVSSSILVQGSAMLIEVLTPIEPLGVFVVERSGTEGPPSCHPGLSLAMTRIRHRHRVYQFFLAVKLEYITGNASTTRMYAWGGGHRRPTRADPDSITDVAEWLTLHLLTSSISKIKDNYVREYKV